MSYTLPNGDPALPNVPNPYFQDNAADRGDQKRNNNSLIWGNLQYIIDSLNALISSFSVIQPGMYMSFAYIPTPNSGFLYCDGSAVSRTTYAELFAKIGTTYGVGNGSTTFNLPDRRGLVGVGSGQHGTLTRYDGNKYDGGITGSTRNDQLLEHGHSTFSTVMGQTNATGSLYVPMVYAPGGGIVSASPNNRSGTENRPAEIAEYVCIKT